MGNADIITVGYDEWDNYIDVRCVMCCKVVSPVGAPNFEVPNVVLFPDGRRGDDYTEAGLCEGCARELR
ncbi:MAG TPA: hypothetical protein VN039_05285, partial [Nitrospira sp.]|nr:hypothetical protein [Nitrospira sp.]